jgi:hypothetical protein
VPMSSWIDSVSHDARIQLLVTHVWGEIILAGSRGSFWRESLVLRWIVLSHLRRVEPMALANIFIHQGRDYPKFVPIDRTPFRADKFHQNFPFPPLPLFSFNISNSFLIPRNSSLCLLCVSSSNLACSFLSSVNSSSSFSCQG